MSANIFDKVLKIIQIVCSLLQMAVRSFTGFNDEEVEDGKD